HQPLPLGRALLLHLRAKSRGRLLAFGKSSEVDLDRMRERVECDGNRASREHLVEASLTCNGSPSRLLAVLDNERLGALEHREHESSRFIWIDALEGGRA